jgi:protein-tyrosine phosphatase
MLTPFRILTVCIGNVCRSPLAERLLRSRLEDAGLGASYDVTSAGLRGVVGHPMEPTAAAELVRLGGDPEGFVARRLTPQLLAQADLVLTATTDIRRRVVEEAPTAMRRTFTLRELALLVGGSSSGTPTDLVADCARRRGVLAGVDLDIADPIGQPAEVHAEAAVLAADAVEAITQALSRLEGRKSV